MNAPYRKHSGLWRTASRAALLLVAVLAGCGQPITLPTVTPAGEVVGSVPKLRELVQIVKQLRDAHAVREQGVVKAYYTLALHPDEDAQVRGGFLPASDRHAVAEYQVLASDIGRTNWAAVTEVLATPSAPEPCRITIYLYSWQQERWLQVLPQDRAASPLQNPPS